jgi:hypothetical protein
MILIGGTELETHEMPLGEMMDYLVENNPQILDIKLKTAAKSANCMAVFVHSDIEVNVPEEVQPKFSTFSTDDELIVLLGGASSKAVEDSDEQEDVEEQLPEVQEFGSNDNSTSITDYVPTEIREMIDVEEVDPNLDGFMVIPNIGDDIDDLKVRMATQQQIIQQKDDRIEEMKRTLDQIYENQEVALIEMRESYEKRVNEVNDTLDKMKQRIQDSELSNEERTFLRFSAYSQNPKAALREGFTQEEVNRLGNLQSPLYVLASGGGGESLRRMLGSVHELIEDGTKALIVDFSNDFFLNAKFGNKSKESSIHLNNDDIAISTLVKEYNKAKVIPSNIYNDISLLTFDWVKIIKKLDVYAGGRPIILLFSDISSFSAKYTVSRLSSIGETFIFTHSNPTVLVTLYMELGYMPHKRFKVVAMNYIEVVEPTLRHLGDHYSTQAFGGKIVWSKINMHV